MAAFCVVCLIVSRARRAAHAAAAASAEAVLFRSARPSRAKSSAAQSTALR
jgi:hypothetical protein